MIPGKRFRKACSFAVTLMLVSGCNSDRFVAYPGRWPPLAPTTAADCAAVNGKYRDKGERAEPSQALFTLTVFGFDSDWSKATAVSLQAGMGAMQVIVFNGPTALFSRSFSEATGDYSCAAGVPLIRTRVSVEGEGVWGSQANTIQFHVSGDFVVLHVKALGSGVSDAVMPGKWSTDDWAKFPKVDLE